MALSTLHLLILASVQGWQANIDADALSRHPHAAPEDNSNSQTEMERIRQFVLYHVSQNETHAAPREVIQAICDRHTVNTTEPETDELTSPGLPLAKSFAVYVSAIPDTFEKEQLDAFPFIPPLTEEELKEKQRSDPTINMVICKLETAPLRVHPEVSKLI